jgi:hypothetical protein
MSPTGVLIFTPFYLHLQTSHKACRNTRGGQGNVSLFKDGFPGEQVFVVVLRRPFLAPKIMALRELGVRSPDPLPVPEVLRPFALIPVAVTGGQRTIRGL